jgi:hypothetical protein
MDSRLIHSRQGERVKKLTRTLGLALARAFGSHIIDHETGRSLGKALIIPWRGKVHVIGLQAAVRPLFLPQKRLTYWKQELGFTVHPPPDFPRIETNETDA